jgi:hypothetical protein
VSANAVGECLRWARRAADFGSGMARAIGDPGGPRMYSVRSGMVLSIGDLAGAPASPAGRRSFGASAGGNITDREHLRRQLHRRVHLQQWQLGQHPEAVEGRTMRLHFVEAGHTAEPFERNGAGLHMRESLPNPFQLNTDSVMRTWIR